MQTLDGGFLPGACREEKHGHGSGAGVGAQCGHQFEPVQSRHHHVADDQVWQAGAHALESLPTVGDDVDVVAGPAEETGQVVAHVGVVVGDQHACRGASDGGRRGAIVECRRLVVRTQPLERLLHVRIRVRRTRARRADGIQVFGGQMRGTERQADGEGGAATFGAFGGDAAAMQFHQLLHQCQPDAAALVRASPRGLDAVESFEQARHLGGGHTDPGVRHGDHRVCTLPSDSHGDGAVERELQCVRQEVEHHLLPHVPVEVHRFVQRRAVHLEGQTGLVDRRPEHARQLGGGAREIGGDVSGLHAARLEPGEVQQRVDELGEPQAVAVSDVQFLPH